MIGCDAHDRCEQGPCKVTPDPALVQAAREALREYTTLGIDALVARIAAFGAEQRADVANALEKYGQHEDDCARYKFFGPVDRWPSCSCGFDAALRAARSEGT